MSVDKKLENKILAFVKKHENVTYRQIQNAFTENALIVLHCIEELEASRQIEKDLKTEIYSIPHIVFPINKGEFALIKLNKKQLAELRKKVNGLKLTKGLQKEIDIPYIARRNQSITF